MGSLRGYSPRAVPLRSASGDMDTSRLLSAARCRRNSPTPLLVLDIAPEHIKRCVSARIQGIRLCPKHFFTPVSSFYFIGKFFSNPATGHTFEVVHKFTQLNLRKKPEDDVNVIRLSAKLHQFALPFLAQIPCNLFQSFQHCRSDYLTSVLRC